MKPRMMLFAFAVLTAAATAPTRAENETPPPDGAEQPTPSFTHLKAPEAVREGNRLLLDDKPVPALEAYRHAEELEPDAREIDFVQGLAHFKLGEYDRAREAFENAATSSNESLVDDAIYSIGTTYHAQALQSADNPQEAIARLENAMQRYHTVLANRPDHAAAADANYKAASMWRSLKEQLEQQQQQQQNQCDSEENQEEQEQQNQNEQQDQEQQEQKQQQDQDQQQEQSQQVNESEQEQDQQEEQQARESQEEQVSREQAERKLREMMQALRDRKKERPKRIQPVKAVPVDKDW